MAGSRRARTAPSPSASFTFPLEDTLECLSTTLSVPPPFVYLSLSLFLSISLSLVLFHSRTAWADARSCMSRMKTVPNAASSPDENQPLRATSAFTSVPVAACDENACVVNNAHAKRASLLFSFSLCSLSAISSACEREQGTRNLLEGWTKYDGDLTLRRSPDEHLTLMRYEDTKDVTLRKSEDFRVSTNRML